MVDWNQIEARSVKWYELGQDQLALRNLRKIYSEDFYALCVWEFDVEREIAVLSNKLVILLLGFFSRKDNDHILLQVKDVSQLDLLFSCFDLLFFDYLLLKEPFEFTFLQNTPKR